MVLLSFDEVVELCREHGLGEVNAAGKDVDGSDNAS